MRSFAVLSLASIRRQRPALVHATPQDVAVCVHPWHRSWPADCRRERARRMAVCMAQMGVLM
jgi:hypothetical protein